MGRAPSRTAIAAVLPLLASAFACAHSCAAPVPGLSPEAALTDPPRKFLDGGETRVHLLARRFLVRGQAEPGRYAYYAYLLFSDGAGDGADARRGAAVAYLRLLRDVTEVGGLVKEEEMAVLFAPLRDRASAAAILRSRDVDAFLAAYDYDRARLLVGELRRAGVEVPRVAIVGRRAPFTADRPIAKEAVGFVDLDVAGEAQAEQRLLRFQKELEAGKTDVSQRGEMVVLALMRKLFAALGGVVGDLASIG